MLRFLKRSREAMLDRHPLADDPINFLFSGCTYALWRAAAVPTRLAAAGGLVLDAGSGRGGWSRVIAAAGGRRESLDIAPRGDERPDWIADLTAMPGVPDARFDAVVCHQVLEHVPAPWRAMAELHRVLRPGGGMVLSTPHLSRRHELPHDYFRFTEEGLIRLARDAGFDVEGVVRYGGVLTFLHHQFSTLGLGALAAWRPFYLCFIALNAPLSMLTARLDRLLDPRGLAANGVVVVLRRPGIST
jgi:SAM-dependent methyltransferase